ncbi:MAG: hypothetical protein WD669_03490 [Pirellulales bacterium]
MNDEPLEPFEQRLLSMRARQAPQQLRSSVLSEVQRELRRARWDRRFARAAAVLLVAGIGLNAAVVWRTAGPGHSLSANVARSNSRPWLVETAVIVAEATDAATGIRFAHQMAAMGGRTLTADESAALDAAVRQASTNGDRG